MEVELKVPKKYLERFACLEREYDLIDGCKYMLYFKDGWALQDFTNVPVFSKKEALEFIRNANRFDHETMQYIN